MVYLITSSNPVALCFFLYTLESKFYSYPSGLWINDSLLLLFGGPTEVGFKED
jgi:hypothetical protein